MFVELRELLHSGAIRKHQLGGKRPFDPNIIISHSRISVTGKYKKGCPNIRQPKESDIRNPLATCS